MRCLVCGESGSPRRRLDVRGYTLAECRRCGIPRLDPLPPEAEILDAYGPAYFEAGGQGYPGYLSDEEAHRATARRRLGALGRWVSGGRILDVGCAAGILLNEARGMGFDPVGSEPCAEMVAIAQGRFGLPVTVGAGVPGTLADGSVDVVMFNQVLAHLRDPRGGLLDALRVLRPGGVLAIETWDAQSPVARIAGSRWPLLTPPTVLYYFGRRSLPLLLESVGFEVLDARSGGKTISAAHALSVLADKYPPASRLRSLGLRPPLSRIKVPFGFGQLLTTWARKA